MPNQSPAEPPTVPPPSNVFVEEDPTPLVGLVCSTLRERLDDPSFASRAGALAATGVIRDLGTPQAVTLRFQDGSCRLEHGADPAAAATVAIDLSGSDPEPQVSGAEANGNLIEVLTALLEPPAVGWRALAEDFWDVASSRSGAPTGLLVCESTDGDTVLLGAAEPDPYEIHGPAGALCAVFRGRLPLAEALIQGAVCARGSFAQLSVLTGAGFAILAGGGE